MERQSYRVGGAILVLAALISTGGGFLHGPQPPTFEAFGAIDHSRWHLSHVAIGLSATLFAASGIFLTLTMRRQVGEPWAYAAAPLLLLAAVCSFMVGMLETTGFANAVRLQGAGNPAGGEYTYQAVTAVMASFSRGAAFCGAAAGLLYALAMLSSPIWPRWLAATGIMLGAALLGMRVFGIVLPQAVAALPQHLGNVWWGAAGIVLFLMHRTTAAARVPSDFEAQARV